MGSSWFKAIESAFEAIGSALEQVGEQIQLIITECTNTSYPEAVGFAYRGILEAPASPLFEKYLSVNSSQHLDYHYASVRDSLTPEQVVGFDQSLQATLGGSGAVVFGGVGVVALALAVLFDVVAAQMKGQTPLPDPMRQIFHGEGEALSKMRAAMSDCLDRLPRSGNDKKKMELETNRCLLQVRSTLHNYTLEVLDQAQATGQYVNGTERNHLLNAYLVYAHLVIHYTRFESTEKFKSLTATDEETGKMLLLYAFTPNVTYAMQNWENKLFNKTIDCVQPSVVEFIGLLNKGQSTYATTLRDRNMLYEQRQDFVISN